nr:hypothetical protein [uncultured Rhodopila sp.]
MRRVAGAMLILAATAAAAPEPVGSWLLACDGAACVLRHKDRLFSGAGVSADMEVRAVGRALVPVVTLRGLPDQILLASAMAAKAEASVQFPGAARVDLTCAIGDGGYVCAPSDAAVAALAAALPKARSVAVRVAVSVSGTNVQPARERSLDLAGTPEALARLRAAGAPSAEPGGWVGLLDRGMKAAGYKDGAADLPGLVARYWGR